jgi:hypothetical protein
MTFQDAQRFIAWFVLDALDEMELDALDGDAGSMRRCGERGPRELSSERASKTSRSA